MYHKLVAALATSQGSAGDVARSSGDIVVAVGERAKMINKKHHVTDKAKLAANASMKKAKECDEKHHVLEKTKRMGSLGIEKAKAMNEKHHIVEKTTNRLSLLAKKISPKKK